MGRHGSTEAEIVRWTYRMLCSARTNSLSSARIFCLRTTCLRAGWVSTLLLDGYGRSATTRLMGHRLKLCLPPHRGLERKAAELLDAEQQVGPLRRPRARLKCRRERGTETVCGSVM